MIHSPLSVADARPAAPATDARALADALIGELRRGQSARAMNRFWANHARQIDWLQDEHPMQFRRFLQGVEAHAKGAA
ncbi:MAG: hypothetical protein AAF565_17945 [Pseudomonadota bacterium]